MARLAFFGTPEFSLPAFEAVVRFAARYDHTIVFVVTQPDARAGRGKMFAFSPVKKRALELGFRVLQPSSLRKNTEEGQNFYREFVDGRIDLAVVVAYGNIITQRLLSAARLAFVNIHGSLLPKYRGAAPIQRAIEAGDYKTGVCLMNMVLKLDEGDILAHKQTPILSWDSSATLFRRISYLGATLLVEHLDDLLHQRLVKIPQSSEGILYASLLSKPEGAFRADVSGSVIARRARAFDPWPSLYGFINKRRVKLFDSFFIATKRHCEKKPGTIVAISNFLGVRAIDGIVYFQSLQFEGKNRLPIREVLAAQSIKIGEQIMHNSG